MAKRKSRKQPKTISVVPGMYHLLRDFPREIKEVSAAVGASSDVSKVLRVGTVPIPKSRTKVETVVQFCRCANVPPDSLLIDADDVRAVWDGLRHWGGRSIESWNSSSCAWRDPNFGPSLALVIAAKRNARWSDAIKGRTTTAQLRNSKASAVQRLAGEIERGFILNLFKGGENIPVTPASVLDALGHRLAPHQAKYGKILMALRWMSDTAILEHVNDDQFQLTRLDETEVDFLMECRIFVETRLAKGLLLMSRSTVEAAVEKMKECNEAMRAIMKSWKPTKKSRSNPSITSSSESEWQDDFVQLDLSFHMAIAMQYGNFIHGRIAWLLHALRLQQAAFCSNKDSKALNAICDEHARIVEAIERRPVRLLDVEETYAIHLYEARRRIVPRAMQPQS